MNGLVTFGLRDLKSGPQYTQLYIPIRVRALLGPISLLLGLY